MTPPWGGALFADVGAAAAATLVAMDAMVDMASRQDAAYSASTWANLFYLLCELQRGGYGPLKHWGDDVMFMVLFGR